MDKEDFLRNIPREGFIKITRPEAPKLSSEQKVHLIRKGNALFTDGDFDQAKKIFVATGYSDGMIRLGDRFMDRGDALSALQMYKMAPAPDKAEAVIILLTKAVRKWLKE